MEQRLRTRLIRQLVLVSVLLSLPVGAWADLSLETETARLPAAGHGEFSLALEYQTSSGGTEFAVPVAIEYGY